MDRFKVGEILEVWPNKWPNITIDALIIEIVPDNLCNVLERRGPNTPWRKDDLVHCTLSWMIDYEVISHGVKDEA